MKLRVVWSQTLWESKTIYIYYGGMEMRLQEENANLSSFFNNLTFQDAS